MIVLPAAYLAIRKWLQNFTFHTDIPVWTFAAAGVVVLCLAMATVGCQALRSARENPVESLRYG